MSKLSFESKNWITIPAGVYGTGNQIPEGWELWLAPQDELMPIPTKMQEGSTVPAIAGGPAECVHKGANINPDGSANLPPDELLGQPRALVLDGERCYKIFGGIPNAVILKTVLAGTPGSLLLVTVPVLGETQNQPTPPNTKLEDDHFIARVGMGTDVDVANYAMMIVERGIENNQRPWYVFVVSSIVPSSGELDLEILLQTNWAGGTDWFIDDINVREELEEEDGDDNDNDGDDIDDVLPDAAKPWATIINIAFEEVQKVVGLSDFQRGYIEAIQSLWERL